MALGPIYRGTLDNYRLAYHQLVLTRALGRTCSIRSAYQTGIRRLMVTGHLEALTGSPNTALAIIRQRRAGLLAVSDFASNSRLVKPCLAPLTRELSSAEPVLGDSG